MFKCKLNDSLYEIEFPSDLSSINSSEVLFEDDLLLINKAGLAACKKFLKKDSANELISLKIPQSFFATDVSFLKNKTKIRDYVIGRFSQNQLIAPFFKKSFYPANFKLKSYQKDGINWLKQAHGRLLADDMGLGKTAQSLVAATELFKSAEIERVLIVCPRSLMQNWADEIEIWAQSFKCYLVSSNVNSEKLWKGIIKHGHFFIINYDQMRSVQNSINEFSPDLIICDEAHKLRKKTSLIHKGLKKISPLSKRFWALTGTPIEKNTDDLISLMQIVTPNIFNSSTRKLSPLAIKGLVRKNVLRRLKSDVLNDIGDLNQKTFYLELEEIQQNEYDKIKKKMLLSAGEDTLKYFNDLRGICDEFNGSSVKYSFAMDLIEKIKYKNEKVIIFSYKLNSLKTMHEMIQKDFGINSSLIYEGKMDLDERNNVINIFKNNIETFALLCSGKIAGEGLNLTEANNVIFLNEWWNPSSNNQARDRVHRIGQDKAVSIFNLRTKNTVEESLAQILDKKKSITNEVIEAMVKEL
jgi:SNF2 family DNA or RNA helicase